MDEKRLSELYRRALARTGAVAPSAEELIALAAGRHLGDRHDAAVAALAATPQALALFRMARDSAPAAAELAAEADGLSRRGAQRRERRHEGAGRARRYAAAVGLAAVLALVALRILPGAGSADPALPLSDTILAADSFEAGRGPDRAGAATDEAPIFNDDFGSNG
ncbi:MAG: hypothetical protein JNJ74_06130 [Xanthomonadales bacterium]|nr:hypothetical protein [Xanthomonadales bacterium]